MKTMKSEQPDTYGVNMRKYVLDHEAFMHEKLRELAEDASENTDGNPDENANRDAAKSRESLRAYHEKKLAFLQHERLVHLIALVMSVGLELFALYLVLLQNDASFYAAIVMLGWTVVLAFYVRHYFFLENHTQHWYRIWEELRNNGEI